MTTGWLSTRCGDRPAITQGCAHLINHSAHSLAHLRGHAVLQSWELCVPILCWLCYDHICLSSLSSARDCLKHLSKIGTYEAHTHTYMRWQLRWGPWMCWETKKRSMSNLSTQRQKTVERSTAAILKTSPDLDNKNKILPLHTLKLMHTG